MAVVVEVWAVKARVWKALVYPSEKRLVANVHFQGYLGLLLIPTEVSFPDQEPEHQPCFEGIDLRPPPVLFHVLHIGETEVDSCCFTVM
jgi:hypothetical protein